MNIQELQTEMFRRRLERYSSAEGINILSFDWDAFTGDCRSGFVCCGFCPRPPYYNCRRGAIRKSHELWKKFEDIRLDTVIKKNNRPVALIVSECHVDLGYWISPTDTLLNVDAHHDRYSSAGIKINCGNWAFGILPTRYTHYDYLPDFSNLPGINQRKTVANLDLLFLCLSSPWTPQKTDNAFYSFLKYLVNLCQNKEPVFFGHKAAVLQKRYVKSK